LSKALIRFGFIRYFQIRSPLDNIVEDRGYREENKWGSPEFDKARFPGADCMIKTLHEKYDTQFMISVWPKFYEGTDARKWVIGCLQPYYLFCMR
jgi:alpha-glucosidase (family GH31 glycosyl hydrolase)